MKKEPDLVIAKNKPKSPKYVVTKTDNPQEGECVIEETNLAEACLEALSRLGYTVKERRTYKMTIPDGVYPAIEEAKKQKQKERKILILGS
jgi:hypothetical protein